MSRSAPREPAGPPGSGGPSGDAADAVDDEAPDGGPGDARPGASAPRRRGRNVALLLFYGVAAVMAVAATQQIARQVFYLPAPAAPYASCQEGLLALAEALHHARRAASGTEGEDAALERFRDALLPAWNARDSVAASCRGSARDERALDAIERLRYAEEHAVRREAGELAPLRRRVQTILDNDLGKPGASPASGSDAGPRQ